MLCTTLFYHSLEIVELYEWQKGIQTVRMIRYKRGINTFDEYTVHKQLDVSLTRFITNCARIKNETTS